jgi:hypothetical protein
MTRSAGRRDGVVTRFAAGGGEATARFAGFGRGDGRGGADATAGGLAGSDGGGLGSISGHGSFWKERFPSASRHSKISKSSAGADSDGVAAAQIAKKTRNASTLRIVASPRI